MNETPSPSEAAPWATVRPGGRTSRNTKAIHNAVLELLASGGLEFTFQDIADASGVSRRTLHRRWSDKNALISDALDDYYRQFTVATTGELEPDLRGYLRAFRDFSGTPLELAINGLVAASTGSDFAHANRQSWLRQPDPLTGILHTAHRRGELDPDAELGMLQVQLISPIMMAASIDRHPLTDDDIDVLIRQTLNGVRPRNGSRS